MAALPATPSASIAITIRLNPGLVRMDRRGLLMSCDSPLMKPPPRLGSPRVGAGDRVRRARRIMSIHSRPSISSITAAHRAFGESAPDQFRVAALQVIGKL